MAITSDSAFEQWIDDRRRTVNGIHPRRKFGTCLSREPERDGALEDTHGHDPERTLPLGLVRWQVDFTDQAAKCRSKLFPRRKDADVYLVKVRSLVTNHTDLADSESIKVAEAAKSWLDHCEVRCKTGRRMERSTLRGYMTMCGCTSRMPRSALKTS
jgi:hypothetical protein